jgi:hypothetical protein
MEVKEGRWDIYTRVPAISWFNLFCWLTNTKWPSLLFGEPPGTTQMRSLETRFSIRGANSIRRRVLLWHLVLLFPLRPRASRSKLSSALVVRTVQPSNTVTNTSQWKKHTQLMSQDREYVIVPFAMLLALLKGDFHWEVEDIHNRWFDVLCQERVQYYDNCAKKASTPFKRCE